MPQNTKTRLFQLEPNDRLLLSDGIYYVKGVKTERLLTIGRTPVMTTERECDKEVSKFTSNFSLAHLGNNLFKITNSKKRSKPQ